MKINKKFLLIGSSVVGTGAIAGGVAGGVIGSTVNHSSVNQDGNVEDNGSDNETNGSISLIAQATYANQDFFKSEIFVDQLDSSNLNVALENIIFDNNNLLNFNNYQFVDIQYVNGSATYDKQNHSYFYIQVIPQQGYSWKDTQENDAKTVKVEINNDLILKISDYQNNVATSIEQLEWEENIYINVDSSDEFINSIINTFNGNSSKHSILSSKGLKYVNLTYIENSAVYNKNQASAKFEIVPIENTSWQDNRKKEPRIVTFNFSSIKIASVSIVESLEYELSTFNIFEYNQNAIDKIYQLGMWDNQSFSEKLIPKFIQSQIANIEVLSLKNKLFTSNQTAKAEYIIKPKDGYSFIDHTVDEKVITINISNFKIINFTTSYDEVSLTDINNKYFYINEYGVLYGVKDIGKECTIAIIPKNVTAIYDNAFKDCPKLKTVDFEYGSQLTSIGNNAFSGATNLETIQNFPQSLQTIGEYAFANTNLKKIRLPENVTTISKATFLNCRNLTNFSSVSGIEIIGESAFSNTGLTSFDLTNTKVIKQKAFYDAKSLVELKNYSSSLTEINAYAFSNTKVQYFDFSKTNLKVLKEYAFANADLKNIVVSENIYIYEQYCFANNVNLNNVIFNETTYLVNFYEGVFFGCLNLQNIKLPQKMTKIADKMFMYCANLTQIGIPKSVLNIGNKAFAYCKQLKEVYIPTFGNGYLGENVFEGCESLQKIAFLCSTYDYLSVFATKKTNELIKFFLDASLGSISYFNKTNYKLSMSSKVFDNINSKYNLQILFADSSLVDWAYNQTKTSSGLSKSHFKLMSGKSNSDFLTELYFQLKPIWGWYDNYEAWLKLL